MNQFTQVWAVPPSTVTLHIRDVLVSTAAVVGPVPLVSPVQISDVSGLTNALSLAAQKASDMRSGEPLSSTIAARSTERPAT